MTFVERARTFLIRSIDAKIVQKLSQCLGSTLSNDPAAKDGLR